MNIDLEALQRLSFDVLPMLLDAAVKGLVLLAVASVVTAAMRKTSAAARQMVWLLALAALIALPAASAALPSWNVLPDWAGLKLPGEAKTASESGNPIMNALPAERHAMTATDKYAIDGTEAAFPPIAAIESAGQNEPDNAAAIAPIAGPAATAGATCGDSAWPMWVAPLVVAVWLCGTLVCMLPLMLGHISLWRLGRRARRIAVAADSAEQGAGEPWTALLQRAARAIGLRQPIILLQGNDESMPMVWGMMRPKLLLPAQADEWPADRRWVVLLHELSHIRRRDCLAKLVAHAACALHWFNPAAWIAFKLMQREAETACDDMVLDNLTPTVIGDKVFSAATVAAPEPVRPSDYAQHLLEIAGGLRNGMLTSCSSIAMARKSRLEGRLLAILDGTRNRRALTRLGVMLAAAFVAAVAIPLACIRAESGDGDKALKVAQPADGDDAATAKSEFSEATIVVFDTTTVPAGRWQTLITDDEALRELVEFFPQRGRKSNQAGLWKAGAVVELKRPDGQTVNIQLSGNDGMATWSEGRGDWPVVGDFKAYIERLRRGGDDGDNATNRIDVP